MWEIGKDGAGVKYDGTRAGEKKLNQIIFFCTTWCHTGVTKVTKTDSVFHCPQIEDALKSEIDEL